VKLLISCELTAPPSEVSAFRALTMYATIFKNMDCLIEANEDEIDYYYRWIKHNYAHDFVKQFVRHKEETGIRLSYDRIKKITYNNLNDLIFVVSMSK